MAELVDALLSGSSAARRGGSSPLQGTIFFFEENGTFVGVPQARKLPRSILGSFASLLQWFEYRSFLSTTFLVSRATGAPTGRRTSVAGSRPSEPWLGSGPDCF
jgi:hypothetical protein